MFSSIYSCILSLSLVCNVCSIGVQMARRFDSGGDLAFDTMEDYQRYVDSVRKLYFKGGVRAKPQPLAFTHELARPAACVPEPTCVPIQLAGTGTGNVTASLHAEAWPGCTRLLRCGGCCSHHLLSCQAARSETVLREVLVINTVTFQDEYGMGEELTSLVYYDDVPLQAGGCEPDPAPGVRVRVPRPAAPLQPPPPLPGGPVQVPRYNT